MLKQHQSDAITKALPVLNDGRGFALLFCMGAGKTLTSLTLSNHFDSKSTLVLCPAIAFDTWKTEVEKWTPRPVFFWDSIKAKTKKWQAAFEDFLDSGEKVFVVNIEAFQGDNKDLKACLASFKPEFIILDESSMIKSPVALRTKSLIKNFKGITKKLILTGTEIGTKLTDIYSQVEFLNPGFWALHGIKSAFHFSMCFEIKKKIYLSGGVTREGIKKRSEMTETEQSIYDSNLEKVYKMIEPFSFRVMRDDCQTLPEKVEEDIVFDLNAIENRAYQSMKDELMIEIENADSVLALNAISLFSRLRVLTGGWANTEIHLDCKHSKLDALLQHIELHDDQSIIACAFTHEVVEVYTALYKLGQGVSIFHGSNQATRDKELERFRSGENRFFVCNMSAASKSLNLQFCNVTYRYSRVLSPTDNLQFDARTDRQGQVKNPRFYDLMARGTVDFKVRENILNGVNLLERFQTIGKNELKTLIF